MIFSKKKCEHEARLNDTDRILIKEALELAGRYAILINEQIHASSVIQARIDRAEKYNSELVNSVAVAQKIINEVVPRMEALKLALLKDEHDFLACAVSDFLLRDKS